MSARLMVTANIGVQLEQLLDSATDANAIMTYTSQVESLGIQTYAPVRYHYIHALVQRAEQENPATAAQLKTKALTLLGQYIQDFIRSLTQAKTLVTELAEQYPEQRDELEQLLASASFNTLTRMKKRANRNNTSAQLASLTEKITQAQQKAAVARPDSVSLDASTIAGHSFSEAASKAPGSNIDMFASGAVSEADRELRAVRSFRETSARASTQKRVSRAIADHPADSGPLNSQRLTVESLAIMRQLSPSYLNRFVSYVDTLLWLDQSAVADQS
ncbi:MAG: DUF2894 domain-containing protein [Halioglobus sp.]